MAFTQSNLILVAHGSSNQLFQYVTNDDLTSVKGEGYFTTPVLSKGDVIFASLSMDSTPELATLLVAEVEGGIATVKEASVTKCASCTVAPEEQTTV